MEKDYYQNLLHSIYSKIDKEEQLFLSKLVSTLNELTEKELLTKKAKKEYLNSLQKHNEKNIKMDDTAVKMFNFLEGNIND